MSSAQRRVVVTAVGAITPLGDSLATVHDALCRGQSGLRPVTIFPTDLLPDVEAGEIPGFDAVAYLGRTGLRAVDRTARLSITAAKLALESGGWTAERIAEAEMGLVLGTMFGSVRTISEFDRRAVTAGPSYAQPMMFANTVINAAAGQTAIWHGLRGLNATISGGLTAGLQAIAYASDSIREGRSDVLLAGGVDELCLESLWGFHRAGLLCGSTNGDRCFPIPFDRKRNGFALGEGAALLVLEEATSAAERGAAVLAEISGHGAAFDCSRGQQRRQSVRTVERSIRSALDQAGLEPKELDAVSTSANGSQASDLVLALGLEAALNGSSPHLPVTAPKASLGEGLGFSGALQTALLIEALRTGTLPGIVGLDEPDELLPPISAGPEVQLIGNARGLVCSHDQTGKSAALVLDRLRCTSGSSKQGDTR